MMGLPIFFFGELMQFETLVDSEWPVQPGVLEPEPPGINLTLLRDLGKLPAGIIIEFPRHTALSILRRKGLAVPVGDLTRPCDLCIGLEDLPHLGEPFWVEAA